MSPRLLVTCTTVLGLAAVVSCSSSQHATGSSGSGGHGGAGTGGAPAVMISSLRVAPLAQVANLPYGQPFQLAYQALGTPVGGGAEIPVAAVFSFDRTDIGSFSGATLSGDGTHGGKGNVSAAFSGLTATTTLTVSLTADVALDGLSPSAIGSVITAASTPSLAPAWAYPEESSVIPPNLYGVAFQWKPAATADTSLLELEGAGGQVHVLTKQSSAALDPATWDIAVRLCGPGVITATVYGFAASDPTHAGSAVRKLAMSQASISGAMYYWSSKGDYAPVAPNEDLTAPRGYFRFDFTAAPKGSSSQPFLGFNRAGNNCVGCHAVARDGTLFATSFGGDTHWAALSVASTANPVSWALGGPSDPGSLGNFNAFTPDKKFLLVTNGSTLSAFDLAASTAVPIASFTAPMPATHVAISPSDTTTVLYVEDTQGSGDTRVGRGRIVRLAWNPSTKAFSKRAVLLEDPSASVYYPAISPDGVWVLYNRATTGNSLSNPGAEVWAMRLDGTGSPVMLAGANQAATQSNSWPRWAPFAADDGQGHPRYFFTFSSVRPYQAITGVPQLWLSTFDPAATTGDPSSPAIWLPMQSTSLHNHAAQWTEVFVPQTQ